MYFANKHASCFLHVQKAAHSLSYKQLNPIPYSAHLIAAEAGLRKILRENILFMPGRIHPRSHRRRSRPRTVSNVFTACHIIDRNRGRAHCAIGSCMCFLEISSALTAAFSHRVLLRAISGFPFARRC